MAAGAFLNSSEALMMQLQQLPPRRTWWKRADSFLLLLSVLSVLLGLQLYHEEESGGIVSVSSPYPDSPVVQPLCETEKISRHEVDSMPKNGKPIRFLMLNAENYFVAGEKQRSRYVNHPKPQEEREAVADIISSEKPDIVGLVEMGGPCALADLQQRLEARELHYAYSRVLIRGGEDRALALLSVYPIVLDESCADYGLYGHRKRMMMRGILDVTLRVDDGRLFRVLGVHFKSRVGEDAAASAALREHEARTLALYLQRKMKEYPNLPLLVYGDLNDNPQDASVRILEQGASVGCALHRLKPRDSRGEEWTLYYRRGNTYNTFDHIFFNKPMKQRIKRESVSQIVDIPAARKASDHRAIWCELR